MRTKPDHFYRQSAVIPFRVRNGELQILLVTTRKGRRWTLPKGIVEPDMSPVESAYKEAVEEAGVTGQPSASCLGSYTRRKWGGTCEIAVYPLKVLELLDDWPEKSFRRRAWVGTAKAIQKTGDAGLEPILRALERRLERS